MGCFNMQFSQHAPWCQREVGGTQQVGQSDMNSRLHHRATLSGSCQATGHLLTFLTSFVSLCALIVGHSVGFVPLMHGELLVFLDRHINNTQM